MELCQEKECTIGAERTFKKRPGTTDKGKDYEDLMVANLTLQLLADTDTEDFNIWSNDEKFGAFDDVIVEFATKDKSTEKCALQLKHVLQKKKQLSLKSLTEESGNFSIKKYFTSFQQHSQTRSSCSVILFTNLQFSLRETVEIQLAGLDGGTLHVRIIQSDTKSPFNTNKERGQSYKFEIVNDCNVMPQSKTLMEYEHFFERFFLYTNQTHVDDFKNQILQEMKRQFRCSDEVVEKYLKFVTEWSLREGRKEKLHKDMMQKVIALHLLTSYIHPIYFGEVSDNGKLLQSAISKFHVTVFEKESVEEVTKLWGDCDNGVGEEEMKRTQSKYQISSLSVENRTKLLWLLNKCPLIVDGCPELYAASALCEDGKFIFLGRIPVEELSKKSVFQRLSDLRCHSELWNVLCENFKCVLPGKEVNVKYLIQEHSEFDDNVTTNELLSMVNEPHKIPQDEEQLPGPYISRLLTRNVVMSSFLESIGEHVLVLVSNATDQDTERLRKFEPILLDNYESLEDAPNGNFYVTTKRYSRRDFDKICERHTNMKSSHHFELCKGMLEWTSSKNESDMVNLAQYCVHDHVIEEHDLWETAPGNTIHLVVGNPGIGKSFLLKNLKNQFSKILLTVIFSPQDMTEICDFLEQDDWSSDAIDNFLLDLKFSNRDQFHKSVVKLLMQKREVVYFWDALDEICMDDYLDVMIRLIKILSDRSIMQWLTCRPNLQSTLESKFSVFAKSIVQFSEDQQIDYIRQRLEFLYPDREDLDDVTKKIKNNVAFAKHEDILSIPLQIYMLTEICLRDKEKYSHLLQQKFSLTDLYQYFVDEKFNFYYKEKIQLDSSSLKKLKQTQKNHIRQFEKAALCAILEPEHLRRFNIDCHDCLENFGQEIDCFGFVSEVRGDVDKIAIKFAHISYAEYFSATYFSRRKIPDLQEILFKEKYTNIRYFFDMLMAQNCPAHIAVLYRNYLEVENFTEELRLKDLGGRNVLHLACSWGQRYPLLKFQKEDEFYVLDDKVNPTCEKNLAVQLNGKVYTVKSEASEYLEMLDDLVEKCDANETDGVFEMTSSEYAEKSGCLFSLVAVTEKQKVDFFDLRDDNFNCSVLYYAVTLGMDQFISLFKKYIKLVRTKDNKSLLYLSPVFLKMIR